MIGDDWWWFDQEVLWQLLTFVKIKGLRHSMALWNNWNQVSKCLKLQRIQPLR